MTGDLSILRRADGDAGAPPLIVNDREREDLPGQLRESGGDANDALAFQVVTKDSGSDHDPLLHRSVNPQQSFP